MGLFGVGCVCLFFLCGGLFMVLVGWLGNLGFGGLGGLGGFVVFVFWFSLVFLCCVLGWGFVVGCGFVDLWI